MDVLNTCECWHDDIADICIYDVTKSVYIYYNFFRIKNHGRQSECSMICNIQFSKLHLIHSCFVGDALIYHNAMNFSTPDQDNDYANRHCAKIWGEGWWFNSCFNANLNADYADSTVSDPKYMTWYPWKTHFALKGSLMMIRPKS